MASPSSENRRVAIPDGTQRHEDSRSGFPLWLVVFVAFATASVPWRSQAFTLCGMGGRSACVQPIASAAPPQSPDAYPGKEYSDDPDVPTSEETLVWDGLGDTDTGVDFNGGTQQVDAMANQNDALFSELLGNTTSLVFSVENDSSIYYERPSNPTGPLRGTWATAADINSTGVADVDGLEIWGGMDDSAGPLFPNANAYSLANDPGGVGVFALGGATLFTNSQLAAVIAQLTNLTQQQQDTLEANMDVDGLVLLADSIIWTIEPTGSFDGGEIFTWDGVSASAQFLMHGGHVWDTGFDVRSQFGVALENVNALEAIPEPSTVLMVALGLAGLSRAPRAFGSDLMHHS